MAQTFQPHPRRALVLYNSSGAVNRLRLRVVLDGAETAPSAAPTIAIYDSDGTAVLTATAMTPDSGSDSSYYYDLNTTTVATWLLGRGYRAQFSYVIAGSTYIKQTWLDVVPRLLISDLCGDDLALYHSELADVFERGKVSWAHKVQAAWQQILGDLFGRRDQDGQITPDRLVGSEQLYHWHLYATLAMVFRDLNNADLANMYEEKTAEARNKALASAAYSPSDETDPDADADAENLGMSWLSR